MKQIIFIFNILLSLPLLSQNKYEPFLKNYHFKIYARNKQVGYVTLTLSSSTDMESKFIAEIESYIDIPLLFFSAGSKTHELEYFNDDFLPIRSTLVTMKDDSEVISTVDTFLIDSSNGGCKFKLVKKNKKLKEVELNSDNIVLTVGNGIPVVSTIWNYEIDKTIKFKFVDKQFLKLTTIIFEYHGKTKEGFHRVELKLPHIASKFNIYLDDEKNIVYAEGMGLKIVSGH